MLHTMWLHLQVDATEHEELGKKYDVSGFPKLVMFRSKTGENGEVNVKSSSYNGPREHRGIVNYLDKQSGEAARPINDLKELKAK